MRYLNSVVGKTFVLAERLLTIGSSPASKDDLPVSELGRVTGLIKAITIKSFLRLFFITEVAWLLLVTKDSEGRETYCVNMPRVLTKISPESPSESFTSFPGIVVPIEPYRNHPHCQNSVSFT